MDLILAQNRALAFGVTALNWLRNHIIETMLVVGLGIAAWDIKMDIEQESRLTAVETRLTYIDKAVNNVAPGEPTLRELVEDLHDKLENPDP